MVLDLGTSALHLLTQLVVLARQLAHLRGDHVEEALHLAAVETVPDLPELLLLNIDGCELHGASLCPKMAVPTRTCVDPAAIAAGKSWVMPSESSPASGEMARTALASSLIAEKYGSGAKPSGGKGIRSRRRS